MNAIVEKYFRDKPSLAIQAMLDGLDHYSKLPGVKIDMETFGKSEDGICSGCAATWALAQTLDLTPQQAVNPYWSESYKEVMPEIFEEDIDDFEIAVNDFRVGHPEHLLEMCLGDSWKEKIPKEMSWLETWCLNTNDWEEQLPLIKQYQQRLIELGF